MFPSYFLGGFECATGWNAAGEWIDQVAATQHDTQADLDYRLLRQAGIRAARDGVPWPLVDRGGRFDFRFVTTRMEAARRHRVEVIWDLLHFGYPREVDPFSREFPERLSEYCHAFARHAVRCSPGPYSFTPVNEPSYFAWAGGEVGHFAPHQVGRGWELKVQLVRAAIQAIEAIWSACPAARIVHADPICRVVAPHDGSDRQAEAEEFNFQVVYQSYDMLSGRLLPELGGSRRHLGVVGVNYYWTNQWELGRAPEPLAEDDPRRVPLREILRDVWHRYGGELLVTETSHVGDRRGPWLEELAGECEHLLDEGVPLRGVCLYPILGMPEWHDRGCWARMGLWDLHPRSPTLARVLHRPMFRALRRAQRLEGRQFDDPLGLCYPITTPARKPAAASGHPTTGLTRGTD